MFAEKIKFRKNIYEQLAVQNIVEYYQFLEKKDIPVPYIKKNEIFIKFKEGTNFAVYQRNGYEFYLTETRYETCLRKKLFEEVK